MFLVGDYRHCGTDGNRNRRDGDGASRRQRRLQFLISNKLLIEDIREIIPAVRTVENQASLCHGIQHFQRFKIMYLDAVD